MSEFKDVAHKTVAELFDMLKEKQAEVEFVKAQLSLQRDRNKALEAELTSSRNYGDDLKAQLNNMEACYIQVKKERELLESNINNLTKQFSDCYEVAYAEYKKNADSYYSGKCDAFDLAEQLAGLALRGES